MDDSSSHTDSAHSPQNSPRQTTGRYRGVIASSLNLVQSYSRSQLFVGDNLPSSLSQASFASNYRSHRQRRGIEGGPESESGDDAGSLSASSYENEEDERSDAELSSLLEEDVDAVPSSFRPPNALSRRGLGIGTSWNSRNSHSSAVPFWSRRYSETGGPQSPPFSSPSSNRRALMRTATVESTQLNPQHPTSRYGSILEAEESSRPPSSAVRSSKKRRDKQASVSESTTDSQASRLPSAYCSSTLSQVDGFLAPSIGTSTFGQTLFNAFNVLCGVGLLSEPLAFASIGWIGSVVLFIFCGLSTNFTAKLLARLMLEDRTLLTYNDICYKAFGRSMQYPIAGLFCLELFALSVALMVIFGDSLATIFPSVSADSFKIFAFCLVLPTVFMPFQILSYTSLIGLASSLTLVGTVVIDGLVKKESPGSIFDPAKTTLSPNAKWGLSAGLMMSGFSGHSVMPSLAREMKHPQEFNRMVDYAYLAAGSMYLIIGVAGYLMFGDQVSQEITQDILQTSGFPVGLNRLAIWMVGINPVAKFALCTRPLNLTIEHLLNLSPADASDPHGPPPARRSSTPVPSSHRDHAKVLSSPSQRQGTPRSTHSLLPNLPHNAIQDPPKTLWNKFALLISRTTVTALVVIVSIIMPNFERVMSFLGAFAAFVICTILPVSAELILSRGRERGAMSRAIDYILLITAIIMATIGTTFSFLP